MIARKPITAIHDRVGNQLRENCEREQLDIPGSTVVEELVGSRSLPVNLIASVNVSVTRVAEVGSRRRLAVVGCMAEKLLEAVEETPGDRSRRDTTKSKREFGISKGNQDLTDNNCRQHIGAVVARRSLCRLGWDTRTLWAASSVRLWEEDVRNCCRYR